MPGPIVGGSRVGKRGRPEGDGSSFLRGHRSTLGGWSAAVVAVVCCYCGEVDCVVGAGGEMGRGRVVACWEVIVER